MYGLPGWFGVEELGGYFSSERGASLHVFIQCRFFILTFRGICVIDQSFPI